MSVIIVLSDCPPKLRGDMSKWLLEINTGVYVGNVNARVREKLWIRITENIGKGHATMVYSSRGEQKMEFKVHNAYWQPVDFDGIKLMRRPKHNELSQCRVVSRHSEIQKNKGVSKSVFEKSGIAAFCAANCVILDFETTGLNEKNSDIIEIAAILVERGIATEKIQTFVKSDNPIPEEIKHLTGISDEDLISGKKIKDALLDLLDFAEGLPFVCHNASFEQAFMNEACLRNGINYDNRFIDTLEMSRRLVPSVENNKLITLAKYFDIDCSVCHRAMYDCEITYALYTKLNELAVLKMKED